MTIMVVGIFLAPIIRTMTVLLFRTTDERMLMPAATGVRSRCARAGIRIAVSWLGAPVSITTTNMSLALVPSVLKMVSTAAAAASVLPVMTGCTGEWPRRRCVTATRRHGHASLPYLGPILLMVLVRPALALPAATLVLRMRSFAVKSF